MQARPPPVSQVSQKCGRCFSSVAQCQCPAACRRIRTSPRSVFSICNSTAGGILNVSVMSNLRDDKNGQKFKKNCKGTTGRTFKIPFFACYDKSWHSAYSLGKNVLRLSGDVMMQQHCQQWRDERGRGGWHFGLDGPWKIWTLFGTLACPLPTGQTLDLFWHFRLWWIWQMASISVPMRKSKR